MQTKTINIIAGAAAILAIIFGVSYLKQTTVVNEVNVPKQETPINLGAIPGSEVMGNSFTVGGVTTYFLRQNMIQATTSICSFKNPSSSTTTIQSFSGLITTGQTGANTFDLSTSTSPSGSSTPALVYAHSVGSGAQDTMIWRPNNATSSAAVAGAATNILPGQNADGSSLYTLAPTQYLTYRVASSTVGTGFFGGKCNAEIKELR